MVASGKPEFAETIWPLASSADDQIQFATFRAADRFHPGVLGADREARLRALPTPQRRSALCEIASNSGLDGMELAATLAATDPDPEVVVHVLDSLAFRHGDRHVNRVMQAAPDSVWKALGKESYPDHFTDAHLNARLAAERGAARNAEADPLRLLYRISDERPADAEARVARLIGTVKIESKDMNFERTIAHVYAMYPGAVAAGLVDRIATNLPLPFRVNDYLRESPLLDTGSVAEAALDPSTPRDRLNAAAAVIGPVTTAALFERLFTIDDQIQALDRSSEQLAKYQVSLIDALARTQQRVSSQY